MSSCDDARSSTEPRISEFNMEWITSNNVDRVEATVKVDNAENLVDSPPENHKLDFDEIDLGIGGMARIPRDTTDRNRTSPFAFPSAGGVA